MEVSSVHRIAETISTSGAGLSADPAGEIRDVVQAVRALNQAEMFGEENELQFQMDHATRRMLIRVVNRKTKEVVSQAAPEYVLGLARDLQPEPQPGRPLGRERPGSTQDSKNNPLVR